MRQWSLEGYRQLTQIRHIRGDGIHGRGVCTICGEDITVILLIVNMIGIEGGTEQALLFSHRVTEPSNHRLSHSAMAVLGQGSHTHGSRPHPLNSVFFQIHFKSPGPAQWPAFKTYSKATMPERRGRPIWGKRVATGVKNRTWMAAI